MRIGSLCSGYGGLDLAVESVFNATTAWFVEYDKSPSAILAHHWPDVPNHGDVKATDWTAVKPIDILTAGYPCQPFSSAGKRKGADDPRHLWPGVARAVSVLRPRIVILENVRGHLSLGLPDVIADLAGLGYNARWGIVRAADAGAPHNRTRIFILATDADDGRCRERDAQVGRLPIADLRIAITPPDADIASSEARHRRQGTGDAGRSQPLDCDPADRSRIATADADGRGRQARREGLPFVTDELPIARSDATPADAPDQRRRAHSDRGAGEPQHAAAVVDRAPTPDAEPVSYGEQRDTGRVASASRGSAGQDRHETRPRVASSGEVSGAGDTAVSSGRRPNSVEWGPYRAAIERWEHVIGRLAPAPTIDRNGPRLNPRFVEWMMGLNDGHVTSPDIGLSLTKQLHVLGNGVCPQQAMLAIRALAAL